MSGPTMRALTCALLAFACAPPHKSGIVTAHEPPPRPPPKATAPAPPTLTGTRIVALDSTGSALVIDADSGFLVRTDRHGRPTAQLDVGRGAGLLAYDATQATAFVADRLGDRIVVVGVSRAGTAEVDLAGTDAAGVDLAGVDNGLQILATWSTPAEPYAVALTPDGRTLLVATVADRTLVAYDTRTGTAKWTAALSPEPRGIAVAPDGSRALVSSIGRGSLDDVALGGSHRVTQIHYDLDCDHCESGGVFARGTGGVIFLDERRAVASFQREVPEASFARSSGYGGGTFVPPVTHHVAFLSFEFPDAAPTAQVVAQVPEHQPRTLAWDRSNDALFVAGLGSDTMLHLPGLSKGSTEGVESRASDAFLRARERCGPDGMALTARGDVLVWCSFSRSILRIGGLTDGGRLADDARLREGPALATSAWTDEQHRGHVLFHVNRREINEDGALACATCHPDGRADGLTWHIGGRRHQTPMLAGRVTGTHPYKWDGNDATIAASITTTVGRLFGKGLDAGQTAALAAYIEALPPPRKPTRDPAAIARGRALFEGELGCANCHEGERLTDGDRHVFDGNPAAFDTPSLIGVAASAPYYHDGSAEDLDALMRNFGSVRNMADFEELGVPQKADLKAYLESL